MNVRRSFITVVIICASTFWSAVPASAQSAETERAVEITFDVGDYDGDRGDWPITVVYISGDMAGGEPFKVELRDGDGTVLWSATDTFEDPVTAIAVEQFVAVGRVTEARFSATVPEVAGDVVDRTDTEVLSQGGSGGGSGILALSMVLAVIVVAILFRTPLPSASTERWTK